MERNSIMRWMLPLAGVLMLAPLIVPVAARAQEDTTTNRDRGGNRRLITVSGEGEVRRKPDIVTLSVGVEERGQDVKTLREAAARKAQDAIQALLKAGVKREDIQTSRISIRREWEPQPNPQPATDNKPQGRWVFVVNNTVSVRTTMLDKVGDLLDAVVQAGFNDINGPYFSLEDDAAARRDALVAAVNDARAKADAIAKTSGVTIAALDNVIEGGSIRPPTPMYEGRMMMGAAMDKSTPTPIESGEIVISENVTASFRL